MGILKWSLRISRGSDSLRTPSWSAFRAALAAMECGQEMSCACAHYARLKQLRARARCWGGGVPPDLRVPATTPKDSNPSACASRVRGDTLSQEAQ